MASYMITTARLGFRPWTEVDLDLALGLWGDLQVTRYIDARGALSKEQVQVRLDQEIAAELEHGYQYWPIFALEDGRHIGCCGLRPHGEVGPILELGVHIRSDEWSKGYATEAAQAVIDYAFDVLKIPALFAGHNPSNHASRHLLLKLNFRYSRDAYYQPTGLYHPSYMLTAQEHHAHRGRSGAQTGT